MANIARLGVALGLNSAEFVSGIAAAGKKLEDFANKAAGYGKVAATAFLAATVAAMAYADEIADVAKANDVAIDSVIKLQNALANSGGSAESAGKLLSSFSKFVDDAAGGSFEAQQKLAKMGVTLKDIGNLSTDTLFQKTIKGLADIEDPLTRSARGMDAFGKAGKGVDWVGVAEGMESGAEASKKQAKAVEEAAAAFDMLKQAGRDVNLLISETLGPSLKVTAEYIKQITDNSNLLGNAFKVVFQTIAVLGSDLLFIFQGISDEIAHTIENAKILTTEGIKAAIAANEAYEKRRQQAREDLDLYQARIMGTDAGFMGKGFDDPRIGKPTIGVGREVIPGVDPKAKAAADKAAAEAKKFADMLQQKKFEQEKLELENRYFVTNNLIKKYESEAEQIRIERNKSEAQARLENSQKNSAEENKFTTQNMSMLKEKLITIENKYNEKIAALKYKYKIEEINKEINLEQIRLDNMAAGIIKYEDDNAQIKYNFLNENQKIEIEHEAKKARVIFENNKKNIAENGQVEQQNTLEKNLKLNQIDAEYYANKAARAVKFQEEEAQRNLDQTNEINELLNKEEIRRGQRLKAIEDIADQSRAQLVNLEMAQELFLIDQKSRYMKKEDVDLEKELLQIKYKHDEVVLSIHKNTQLTEDAKEIAYDLENRNLEITIALAKERLQILKDQKSGGMMEGFLFRMDTFGKDMETSFEAGGKAFDSMMSNMSNGLEEFVRKGELDFNKFAGSIIKDMLAIQLRASATNLFSMLGKIAVSAFTGSPTIPMQPGGGYANGGDPPVGVPSMVGERGPELFVPRTAGTIVPNHSLAMMGGSTNNITNYNIQAIDTKSFEDRILGSSKAVWAANAYGAKNLSLGRGRT